MALDVSKKTCQRIHAKRRALERHGLQLNRFDLFEMVKLIQGQKAEFVERQSLRVTVWRVPWGDRKLKVVYDKVRKNIVTVLPVET